jgi:hypothetical protein
MRTVASFLVLLALLPALAPAEAAPDLVRLVPAAIAGWNSSASDKVYTRDTLPGYLKGNAGAYLAYGFRRLFVREYLSAGNARLDIEIYDMSVAADAFGVFRNGPGGEEIAVGQEGLYGAGLLRFWKGPFFVRLIQTRPDAGTKAFLSDLGRKIAAAIAEPGARPVLLGCLPQARLVKASVRYFHKQTTLDAYFYLVDENALLLDEGTEAVLGRYKEARGESMLLVCRYRTPADARRAYLKFCRVYFSQRVDQGGDSVMERIEAGEYAAARLTGACLVLVLESPDGASCEGLVNAAASRIPEVVPRKSPGRD